MTGRFDQRRDRLRRLMRKQELPALLVTHTENIRYLTGFTGEDSYLLLLPRTDVLLSDPRFTTQLNEECPGLKCEIRAPGTSILDALQRCFRTGKSSILGVEGASLTLAAYEAIKSRLESVDLVSTSGLVEQLRLIKDREEVAHLREAVNIAQRSFGVIRASLQSEDTEKEVADLLEYQIRQFGGTQSAFEPIVAVGPRAALPHARPTSCQIGEADFVLVDWGAVSGGYRSDLTRILVTGKISPKLERIYEIVLKAQQRAIKAIRPGVTLNKVDRSARSVIAKAGFEKTFGHGLGHGIGLEIHEAPRLAPKQTRTLQPGMVVTVEPGIYLPGWGGVRIEDDVLVTRTGHEVLSDLERSLGGSIVA